MSLTVDQIKVLVAVKSGLQEEITVTTLIGEKVTGVCTFAGTTKFRVDTPQAAIFFNYDEVEQVD
jgi:hypothetical protein